jgi:hypothetical protein
MASKGGGYTRRKGRKEGRIYSKMRKKTREEN